MINQLERLLREPGARILVVAKSQAARVYLWKMLTAAKLLGLTNNHQQYISKGPNGRWVYLFTEQDVLEGRLAGLHFSNVLLMNNIEGRTKDLIQPWVRSTVLSAEKMSTEVFHL